jgi:hypothetical protein
MTVSPSDSKSVLATLRVAVCLQSFEVPAWHAEILRSLIDSKLASIILVISENRRLAGNAARRGLLCRAVERLENPKRQRIPDAMATVRVDELVGGFEKMSVESLRSSELPPNRRSSQAYKVDVLIALAHPDDLACINSSSRYGTWYFEHRGQAMLPYDGALVGLTEVLSREPCLASSLRVRQANLDLERIAVSTFSPVDCLSHYATRNQHLWKCSKFVRRTLARCHAEGGADFLRSLAPSEPSTESATPCLREPARSGATGRAFISYLAWRIRQRKTRRRHSERWVLLAGRKGVGWRPDALVQLVPPPGRFWADPHCVEKHGAIHVFFEDASLKTGKGRIATMTVGADGRYSTPATVLERPYHLSYPFIFRWNDDYFMIPESAENRAIELYRCLHFPDQWRFEHNLMEDVRAYDTTLVQYQGRWWMFANIAEHEAASTWDELHVFDSDQPLSRDWRPHPLNPVVSDVRRARPAGRLIFEQGRLYRPSQDSSGRYGRALCINEVLELNGHSYRECLVARVEPDPNQGLMAVHSYSTAGPLAFMDAIRREAR